MSDKDAGLIIGWVFALFIGAAFVAMWAVWQGLKLLVRLVKYAWRYAHEHA